MNATPLSGKVQTVVGPVEPNDLGITLTHEHILIDLACYFAMPEEASRRADVHAPLTMDMLGRATRIWIYNHDIQKLLDVDTAISELSRYKYSGGQSVVDATSIGIARDPLALARISRATGLNIIMGASHYVPLSHPPDMDEMSEEDIADQIIRDITIGVGETGVRSGIIGEVGNFWPTRDNERKVLRASAYAQRETGAPILIHPGFDPDSPPAIMSTLIEAGADPQRVIMGHLDVFHDRDLFKSLAETGCFMEWDCFGSEDTSSGQIAHQTVKSTNDVQRLELLEHLFELGYGDKIVVAHDVCMKFQYSRYGGKGYDHLLSNIVPRMRRRGFEEDQIEAILVRNPRNILTFQ